MATTTATKPAAKTAAKTRKPKSPTPEIDFGSISAKASETPVVQTRSSGLDNTPIPQWLTESWAKRTTVQRGGQERIEGAAVELSPMSAAQVSYTKNLMTRAVQRMPGVGVKFSETVNADKSVTLKFQTMQRKARKSAKS